MKPVKGFVWGGAVALVACLASPAHAGWANVFQVCCNNCGSASPAPVVAMYADPTPAASCPQPCPQTTCKTSYVQRSYYQPVTTYRTSYYMEPVTTYKTSYYYEPVTTYRYSCYYDPCTCRYQSVAQPCTSYRLRSQCCPVTSYLQRTCTTPVTTQQLAYYYEPVTTCCTTSVGAATTTLPAGATVNPAPNTSATTEPPAVPAVPGTKETSEPITSDSMKALPRTGFMPPASREGSGETPRRPAYRADRTASRTSHNFEAKVIDVEKSPRSGARILLVSADDKTDQYTMTADESGAFKARLGEGAWLVYTIGAGGKPVFSRRVEVPSDRVVSATLMSR